MSLNKPVVIPLDDHRALSLAAALLGRERKEIMVEAFWTWLKAQPDRLADRVRQAMKEAS